MITTIIIWLTLFIPSGIIGYLLGSKDNPLLPLLALIAWQVWLVVTTFAYIPPILSGLLLGSYVVYMEFLPSKKKDEK